MWKDIPGWENLYKINEYGIIKNKKTDKILVGDKNSSGYCRVCLYYKGKKKRVFRHKMVALLFLNNRNNFSEVNHKDGNKNNNHYSNLEWCDRTQNEREAHRLKIKEYKPFVVKFQNGTLKKYEFAIDLANELNVSKRTIQNYLQHKSEGYLKKHILSIKYL